MTALRLNGHERRPEAPPFALRRALVLETRCTAGCIEGWWPIPDKNGHYRLPLQSGIKCTKCDYGTRRLVPA